jgi:hypothetical protein
MLGELALSINAETRAEASVFFFPTDSQLDKLKKLNELFPAAFPSLPAINDAFAHIFA